MKYRSTSLYEQETTISFSRDMETAKIWTNDTTTYTRLDKCVAQNPDEWKLLEEAVVDGEIASRTYECPKEFISFRSKRTTRVYTEEQKEEMRERMKAMRE